MTHSGNKAVTVAAEKHPSVVVDTNVFIAAAFKPRSDSGRVVDAIRLGVVRMVWSDATRGETEALLRRIPPISWDAVADLFQEADRRSSDIDPGSLTSVTDEEDRKFAALAASHQATLVSLDQHLLGARLEGTCAVCTPSAFIEGLQKSPAGADAESGRSAGAVTP